MAKIDNATTARWMILADNLISAKLPGKTRKDVKTGSDAWTVANMCGILTEAYRDRGIVDAHIKTALAFIFPNAVFTDKYHY